MTFTEYVAEARRIRDARQAQEQADRTKREQDRVALLNDVVARALQRVDASLPDELRPFALYAGDPDIDEATLRKYPTGFTPCDFRIMAPGLQVINFSVSAGDASRQLRVVEIHIGATRFGTDWIEAVAFASDPASVR